MPTLWRRKWLISWRMPRVTLAVVKADKIAAVANRLPRLARIIHDEPREPEDCDHNRLIAFADVQRVGGEKFASDNECLPS